MADKRIDQLTAASSLGDSDLLVVEQSSAAKKATGTVVSDYINSKFGLSGMASDISALQGELKSAINFFDDIPGTVQTVNFDANGNPSSIVHTANGEAVRTDSFTWGVNTVTEKRELADGSYITFVTDLTTLVTTISEIQEA